MEDRWYVRFRGHTLGPLTAAQVKASLRLEELEPTSAIASQRNPSWRPLRTQAEFLRYWESLHTPLPIELTPLPAPKLVWKKKAQVPAPVLEAATVEIEAQAPPPAEPLAPPPEAATSPVPERAAELSSHGAIPVTQLADETFSLLETLREWSKQQEAGKKAPIPSPDLPPWREPTPAPTPRATPLPEPRSNPRIEIHLTASRRFLLVASLVALLTLAAAGFLLWEKMRGPESFRLPDPSGPTTSPSSGNDPIPQLKAPTRPNRN